MKKAVADESGIHRRRRAPVGGIKESAEQPVRMRWRADTRTVSWCCATSFQPYQAGTLSPSRSCLATQVAMRNLQMSPMPARYRERGTNQILSVNIQPRQLITAKNQKLRLAARLPQRRDQGADFRRGAVRPAERYREDRRYSARLHQLPCRRIVQQASNHLNLSGQASSCATYA